MIVISLVIAGLVSWFASPRPDGLERVAEDHGFAEKAANPSFEIFPGYTIPGLGAFWSNGMAGIIGTFITFFFIILLGKSVTRRKVR